MGIFERLSVETMIYYFHNCKIPVLLYIKLFQIHYITLEICKKQTFYFLSNRFLASMQDFGKVSKAEVNVMIVPFLVFAFPMFSSLTLYRVNF